MSPGAAGPGVATGVLVSGRYRLDAPLERFRDDGAPIWRATDEVLAREVAVRVLAADDPRAGAMLRAARASGAVTDATLSRIYDAGETPDLVYVVGELLPGGSLDDLLAEGPLDAERAVELVAELARATARIHAAGLAHLRIHPRNVLFTSGGAVRLSGLGIAAALADHPAEAAGNASVDTHDLGLLLYATLTGRWAGAPDVSTLPPAPYAEGHLCSPRQVRARVPRDLDAITIGALDPHGAGGVGSHTPAELADLLEPLTAPAQLGHPFGEPDETAALFEPLLPAGGRSVRTRIPRLGWSLAGVAAAVVVLAVVVGWAVGKNGTPPPQPTRQPSQASTQPNDEPSRSPIDLRSVTDFDPAGDHEENAAQVKYATDGNAKTAWHTEHYATSDFGRLKPGTGLLVDLGEPTTVAAVRLRLVGEPSAIELRAGDNEPAHATDLRVVAEANGAATMVDLVLPPDTTDRYWLVWFTRLPASPSGDYQSGVAEMTFLH